MYELLHVWLGSDPLLDILSFCLYLSLLFLFSFSSSLLERFTLLTGTVCNFHVAIRVLYCSFVYTRYSLFFWHKGDTYVALDPRSMLLMMSLIIIIRIVTSRAGSRHNPVNT